MAPKPMAPALPPGPPRAQGPSEASVEPEQTSGPELGDPELGDSEAGTAEASAPEVSVPELPVSSEALDAASAISLEPPTYPAIPGYDGTSAESQAGDRDPIAGMDPAPMSPPITRTKEPPASRVHVVYEEAEKTEPAASRPEPPVNLAALVERARSIPEAASPIRPQGRPIWQANAVPAGDPGGRPMIAIVFDDLGLNRPNTRRVIALPGPLTLSFMTYAESLESMTGKARAAGHELMVHMPMEPMDASLDPGRNVLLTGLDQDKNRRRMLWGLDRFTGYVGINNHMGSRFTSQPTGMAMVLAELKRRGLLFLDSKTAVSSVGASLASHFGVPFIERDIFIDNDPEDRDSIRRQLDRLETVARRRGAAVAIGHPHSATIEVLAPWLAGLRARGFVLVPISTLVGRRIRLAEEGDSAG